MISFANAFKYFLAVQIIMPAQLVGFSSALAQTEPLLTSKSRLRQTDRHQATINVMIQDFLKVYQEQYKFDQVDPAVFAQQMSAYESLENKTPSPSAIDKIADDTVVREQAVALIQKIQAIQSETEMISTLQYLMSRFYAEDAQPQEIQGISYLLSLTYEQVYGESFDLALARQQDPAAHATTGMLVGFSVAILGSITKSLVELRKGKGFFKFRTSQKDVKKLPPPTDKDLMTDQSLPLSTSPIRIVKPIYGQPVAAPTLPSLSSSAGSALVPAKGTKAPNEAASWKKLAGSLGQRARSAMANATSKESLREKLHIIGIGAGIGAVWGSVTYVAQTQLKIGALPLRQELTDLEKYHFGLATLRLECDARALLANVVRTPDQLKERAQAINTAIARFHLIARTSPESLVASQLDTELIRLDRASGTVSDSNGQLLFYCPALMGTSLNQSSVANLMSVQSILTQIVADYTLLVGTDAAVALVSSLDAYLDNLSELETIQIPRLVQRTQENANTYISHLANSAGDDSQQLFETFITQNSDDADFEGLQKIALELVSLAVREPVLYHQFAVLMLSKYHTQANWQLPLLRLAVLVQKGLDESGTQYLNTAGTLKLAVAGLVGADSLDQAKALVEQPIASNRLPYLLTDAIRRAPLTEGLKLAGVSSFDGYNGVANLVSLFALSNYLQIFDLRCKFESFASEIRKNLRYTTLSSDIAATGLLDQLELTSQLNNLFYQKHASVFGIQAKDLEMDQPTNSYRCSSKDQTDGQFKNPAYGLFDLSADILSLSLKARGK